MTVGTVATEAPKVDVYSETSNTLISHRDLPWMKLGPTFDGPALTAKEAAEQGGLDFNVKLLPAGYVEVEDAVNEQANAAPDIDLVELREQVAAVNGAEAMRKFGRQVPALLAYISALEAQHGSGFKQVTSRRAVVREDNGTWIGYVSGDYKPVQYSEAFEFMDQVNPRYVAAGTLGGGRQGFMVVQFPELDRVEYDVNGVADPHNVYGILRTSHDLSKAIEVAVLMLRDKCMNQLTLRSLTHNSQQHWSIRHVGNPHAKLAQATESLAKTRAYVEDMAAMNRRLAQVDIELDEFEQLLRNTILPDRPKREEQITSITQAWLNDPTVGTSELGRNGYTATQAVNTYFEWGRESGVRTASSRFTGGLNGATHKFTNRTAGVILARGASRR